MSDTPTIDWARVRGDFPILAAEHPCGKPVAYLDNAATTQKPDAVIDAITAYYRGSNANVHRGVHWLAEKATVSYEGSRGIVARFVNAPSDRCVVFTRGTTEAINLVAHGWGPPNLGPGDLVLTTELEHHSNFVPWQMVCDATGAELAMVPMCDDGTLDQDAYATLLKREPKLVAFNHISNGLGTINPAAAMIQQAHDAGSLVLLDAAQSVGHMPVDVQALGADFLAFSGHKICGPTGIGALVAREALLDTMEPYQGGGEMISSVTLTETKWNELPYKFEAGTPNICGSIAMGTAMKYLMDLGLPAIHDRTHELMEALLERMATLNGYAPWGSPAERGGALSFRIDDIHPHDLSQILDEQGVAIRAGQLCCQPIMDHYGVPGMSRASLSFYNDLSDIDRLVDGIRVAQKLFGRG